jgi:lipoprotein-anchoring transpeptidase ErfK/SrfK
VPDTALDGSHVVSTHLVVDHRTLTATLYRGGRRIFETPVGVGQDRYPTPTGEFYIRDLVIGYTDPAYGPAAFGTSARSRVLTDWPNGGYIGIHGTNDPSILPGRVSHGCIRMRNSAIATLRRLMPVGTPLTIR